MFRLSNKKEKIMKQSKFKRWLERMAKANRKEFGYERLEFCNVNNPEKTFNKTSKN